MKSAPANEEPPASLAQATASDPVDPQPASDAKPVTENASGITAVAQFIPSDANLDQPTLSPSEPLADGEANIDTDQLMSDAPTQISDSARASKTEPQLTEDIQTAPAVDSATSVPTPPEEKAVPELTNGSAMTESHVSTGGEQTAASVKGTSTPQLVDQPMIDTPSSGTVRPRDDADDEDAPAAKRARTDELSNEAQAVSRQPPAQSAAPTTNGNGVRPQAPASAAPHFSSDPMTSSQRTVLLEKMKNTKKVKSAAFFLKPVDPIALNIPQYPDIIRKPMDLGTMERKLKTNEYKSVDHFVADFELMVANCLTFNGPQHVVSVAAQNLRAYFMKQMETVPTGSNALPKPVSKKASPAVAKPPPARRESRTIAAPGAARSPTTDTNTYALLPSGTPMIRRDSTAGRPKRAVIPPQRDLPYSNTKPKRKENQMGLKFCEHILEEFRKAKYDRFTVAFREPVDPVALNIPMYFSIIKRPMDLQTMTNKLKNGAYSTASEFKADFELMLDNCFKFNPADNIVHQMGKELQTAFEREWSRKDAWIKKNTPQSQRASPASDAESDGDDSDGDDDDAEADSNEATIAALREQLANMQNMVAAISGGKPVKPKKKKMSSGTIAKPTKKVSAPVSKASVKTAAKPKKQRTVTYEEKQEISNATEKMNDEQITKLTTIITENVAKYKVSLSIVALTYATMY